MNSPCPSGLQQCLYPNRQPVLKTRPQICVSLVPSVSLSDYWLLIPTTCNQQSTPLQPSQMASPELLAVSTPTCSWCWTSRNWIPWHLREVPLIFNVKGWHPFQKVAFEGLQEPLYITSGPACWKESRSLYLVVLTVVPWKGGKCWNTWNCLKKIHREQLFIPFFLSFHTK